jgi:hypothetical protein
MSKRLAPNVPSKSSGKVNRQNRTPNDSDVEEDEGDVDENAENIEVLVPSFIPRAQDCNT